MIYSVGVKLERRKQDEKAISHATAIITLEKKNVGKKSHQFLSGNRKWGHGHQVFDSAASSGWVRDGRLSLDAEGFGAPCIFEDQGYTDAAPLF